MYNIVKIGDKDVPMLSMAAVDVFYKNIFHSDPLKDQLHASDEADSINFVLQMAFVMAKYAEFKDRKNMLKLNEDSYYEWLEQFERIDLINAMPDAQATYDGQMLGVEKAKKNNDEPSES